MYQQEMYSHYWAAAPIVQEQPGYPNLQQPPQPHQQPQQQQQHFAQQYSDQYSGQQTIHTGHVVTNQHLALPQQQQQQQQQGYTPTDVLRGIAADDSGLQETWTTYMNNVSMFW
jgi:hypothetical protein